MEAYQDNGAYENSSFTNAEMVRTLQLYSAAQQTLMFCSDKASPQISRDAIRVTNAISEIGGSLIQLQPSPMNGAQIAEEQLVLFELEPVIIDDEVDMFGLPPFLIPVLKVNVPLITELIQGMGESFTRQLLATDLVAQNHAANIFLTDMLPEKGLRKTAEEAVTLRSEYAKKHAPLVGAKHIIKRTRGKSKEIAQKEVGIVNFVTDITITDLQEAAKTKLEELQEEAGMHELLSQQVNLQPETVEEAEELRLIQASGKIKDHAIAILEVIAGIFPDMEDFSRHLFLRAVCNQNLLNQVYDHLLLATVIEIAKDIGAQEQTDSHGRRKRHAVSFIEAADIENQATDALLQMPEKRRTKLVARTMIDTWLEEFVPDPEELEETP